MKPSPRVITELAPNEIFVFGSNLAGRHGKGAALQAWSRFGAVDGVGIGFQGRCYAIPTKSRELKTLPLALIRQFVQWFIEHAADRPEQVFLVTEIGCGLAGYAPEQIAPMFRGAPDNVRLPQRFIDVLESKKKRKKVTIKGNAPKGAFYQGTVTGRFSTSANLGFNIRRENEPNNS